VNHPLLVVNADGFGTSSPVNRGILTAHEKGILTSTNILGNCLDPGGVVATLQSHDSLGVGVQLALVGGLPVARPQRIPSLLGPSGNLAERPEDVILQWAKAALRQEDLEQEFDAQVSRLRDHGLFPDHLCVQHHLGFLPVVIRAAQTVAKKHRIAGLRVTVEAPNMAWITEVPRGARMAALAALAWFSRREMGILRHGPQTWGYFESGRLDEVRILEILGRLRQGSHELFCHPVIEGDTPAPRSELTALKSVRVRDALIQRGITLCRWADLY
jgi:predicted glycoside hydrolase/deacetylase ChbG (UPF0249 family)